MIFLLFRNLGKRRLCHYSLRLPVQGYNDKDSYRIRLVFRRRQYLRRTRRQFRYGWCLLGLDCI